MTQRKHPADRYSGQACRLIRSKIPEHGNGSIPPGLHDSVMLTSRYVSEHQHFAYRARYYP
ncbi:hypothetical protein [Undibacterium luofuense]|uniref:Uncharacterized protein n=1 Tax=Undibacterium luofuense TaxID=2828733 RepID=A0A941I607_9BURK|nr:hypothetical protein [Undibacterium luofuense]MBR7781090.1 hypothetical protein [Undibacterium luofuense]